MDDWIGEDSVYAVCVCARTYTCVCAFVCAYTRLFCRDRWLIEYRAVGGWGWGGRVNLGAVRADGRWEELQPVRPKDGFSTRFLWEQNSEISWKNGGRKIFWVCLL